MRRVNAFAAVLALLASLTLVSPANAAAHTALLLYWNPYHGDNYTSGTRAGDPGGGWGYVRYEGFGLVTQDPGTIALHTFYSPARADYFTTASNQGFADAYAVDYVYLRREAYIFTTQVANTVPLYQFWHPGRGDNFLTASSAGITAAYTAGYTFVRVEGYVYAA